jgi:RNA polymerase sigma-70 factor, ECF subfamily
MSSYPKRTLSDSDNPYSSEYELVIQAQNGDQAAFERIYVVYTNRLSLFLSRMVGNDAIGCELAQETLVKAWRHIASLQDPRSFAAWLFQIARNCAHDYLNSKQATRTIPLDSYPENGVHLCVDGPEEQVERQELLRIALNGVSPIYRECLVLSMFQRVPQRQIAEMLNMNEASVGQYVLRGKKELRSIYLSLCDDKAGRQRS